MDFTIISVVALIFVWFKFSLALQYKIVVRYHENDDLYSDRYHIVDVVDVLNAKRCAAVCGQHADCLSLFYNSVSKTCRLHSVTYFTDSDCIPASNWIFYVIENKVCPAHLGFIHYQADGFCLHVAKTTYTFSDGQQYCSQRNARILSLETTEKRVAFSNLIGRPDIPPLPKTAILLSLKKTNGIWRWESGVALSDSNWGTGQPFCPSHLTCECVGLLLTWAGHAWNDDVCNGVRSLICEYTGY